MLMVRISSWRHGDSLESARMGVTTQRDERRLQMGAPLPHLNTDLAPTGWSLIGCDSGWGGQPGAQVILRLTHLDVLGASRGPSAGDCKPVGGPPGSDSTKGSSGLWSSRG